MKSYLLQISGLAALVLLLHTNVSAQQSDSTPPPPAIKDTEVAPGKLHEDDEIVIKRKSDKDAKVTVEIKDGQVFINGKPVSEFNDDNLSVRKKKIMIMDGRVFNFSGPDDFGGTVDLAVPAVPGEPAVPAIPGAPGSPDITIAPGSPFRNKSGTWSIDGHEFPGNANRAFLGVTSERTEKEGEGARVKEVSKGSAAEKAGLKEGDLITRVDEITITDPQSLSGAIHKYKPEDKIKLTYKRDGKEVRTTVTLGKAKDAGVYVNTLPRIEDFDFKGMPVPNPPGAYGYGWSGNSRPRLGIKAQDTEDGKGVKVLEVGDESAAEKAGVKEGDIITRFDGKEVNSAAALAELARAAKDKPSVKINLVRDGKPQEIEVKTPKKLRTADL